MTLRRGISLLAIWGVLLHASIVVRHNEMALSHHVLAQELAQALGVICRSAGGTMKAVSPNTPAPIDLSGQQMDCPLCTGMMSAAADLPAIQVRSPRQTATELRMAAIALVLRERVAFRWPPPRGPPLIA